jgi:hypothetical protein
VHFGEGTAEWRRAITVVQDADQVHDRAHHSDEARQFVVAQTVGLDYLHTRQRQQVFGTLAPARRDQHSTTALGQACDQVPAKETRSTEH